MLPSSNLRNSSCASSATFPTALFPFCAALSTALFGFTLDELQLPVRPPARSLAALPPHRLPLAARSFGLLQLPPPPPEELLPPPPSNLRNSSCASSATLPTAFFPSCAALSTALFGFTSDELPLPAPPLHVR